ncbi:BglG family transcription antiterminator LicT [Yersinia enterocolitica]|uniref:BglG family transcription antiterminator LicT n=1 Tax=Yersinia sp. 2545 StPb PI TaxID=3117410 RepID=UPI0009F196B0|nr:PRD domain-containing protein [Yersinia enterocolitica]
MDVIKVLNNSLVLSVDANNNEVIVMGKGIGFNSKIGDAIDAGKIEKVYVVQNTQTSREYVRLIENTPEEYISLVQNIMSDANASLKGKLSEQLFFTLTDHITFAIERFHKGISIQNRLLYEVKRFYPHEFSIAQQAVKYLNEKLNIQLPEEEAGNIAFHLVNGQTDIQSMESTLLSVKMLKDIFNIIKYHFNVVIDQDSLNYQRFLTHMQFFIQRMIERNQIETKDDFIFEQMIREYPGEYRCSMLIGEYIKNLLSITLSNDEMLYLIIHLVRIAGSSIDEE